MLKKSLIAVAVLAIAMPVVAGEIKIHGNWPCKYVPQDVTTVKVILDVGFYIHIKDQDPFPVTQDTSAKDPYHTYTGCFDSPVDTNFEATISASITGSGSAAGGSWSVTSISVDGGGPVVVPGATNNLVICVKGTDVKIENLTGGDKKVHVADLTIKAVPTAACAACGD